MHARGWRARAASTRVRPVRGGSYAPAGTRPRRQRRVEDHETGQRQPDVADRCHRHARNVGNTPSIDQRLAAILGDDPPELRGDPRQRQLRNAIRRKPAVLLEEVPRRQIERLANSRMKNRPSPPSPSSRTAPGTFGTSTTRPLRSAGSSRRTGRRLTQQQQPVGQDPPGAPRSAPAPRRSAGSRAAPAAPRVLDALPDTHARRATRSRFPKTADRWSASR